MSSLLAANRQSQMGTFNVTCSHYFVGGVLDEDKLPFVQWGTLPAVLIGFDVMSLLDTSSYPLIHERTPLPVLLCAHAHSRRTNARTHTHVHVHGIHTHTRAKTQTPSGYA